MKVKTLAIVVLSALSLSSTAVMAVENTVSGSSVHFVGDVVNGACAVAASSVDQTVKLDQIRAASLTEVGKIGGAVGFNIELTDCNSMVARTASIAFTGTTVEGETNVLALQGDSAGSARNVGIQILDKTGVPLGLDGSAFSTATDLNDGTNIIPFQARYYSMGGAIAGSANADATFKIKFE